METKEWCFTDKSKWPDGEWHNEPDKKQWLDGETGLPCMIHRGPSGALCGYVGVDKSHPAHGKDYYSVNFDVHGGLTYAEGCAELRDDGSGICHITDDGDHVWWFGFDCAHIGDICPSSDRDWIEPESTYKPWGYVESEVRSLARQLKELIK